MRAWPIALLLCLLLAACAQVRDITGGDKDAQGPVLENAAPANGTVNFAGDRFLLHFDERITIERMREGLPVSPPLDAPPTLSIARGSDLEVRLNAPLKANTTYTFSVGEVVKDLTEGNTAAGVDYVISTGPVLDSLEIHGHVTQAFAGAPEKDVLVLLHDATDTSDFRGSRPLYGTRTNAQGAFVLRHLRQGDYRVTAVRDLNTNYRYDLPKEEIAFADSIVQPHSAGDTIAAPIELRLFQEMSAVQAIREANVSVDRAWRLILARPALELTLRDVERTGGNLVWSSEWSDARDTVLLWPSDTTALADGRFEVSVDGIALDTLRYRALRLMPFHVGLRSAGALDEVTARVRLESTRPLAGIDTARISLRKDSTGIPFKLLPDPAHERFAVLEADIAPGSSATLLLLPKALRDRYNGWNDTLRIALGRDGEQASGKLRVAVRSAVPTKGQLVLELLDQQGHVIRRSPVDPTGAAVVWERIAPGNHTLRLTADINGNGRWDTGSYGTKRQPERVWRYPDPVNVRASWDLGIDWILEP